MTAAASRIGLPTDASPVAAGVWFLSGPTRPGDAVRHTPLETSPFSIGRRAGMSLVLNYKTVSSQHAQLVARQDGTLWLEDLGSTNGTYVNGRRLHGSTQLSEEDLVHFAEAPFRIRRQSLTSLTSGTIAENVCDQALALVQFDRLMSQRLVVPHFQPIVDILSGECVGHEVLGRSRVYGMESIRQMFYAAAQLNLEIELSRMLRWEGVRVGRDIIGRPPLYVNTHPTELIGDGLADSLIRLRELAGNQNLVLEIHEAAVTELATMRRLRDRMRELGIKLAFDDFGSGQARLQELVEIRPDVLKFDISLVRSIDTAGPERQKMLGALVNMVRELSIVPLAEGIETPGEAAVCKQLGFETAQGFHFGRPAPLNLN
jgi:EAL domain-containing protein (putative c-di-GMP-specific phosphodiesterase class I)